jgi:hypothetical protein
MSDLRAAMPLLVRSEGVWDGVYRYYDASGALTDEHASRLICRLPDSGPYPYHQTNLYTWADGRTETRDFPASYKDGRIWFDTPLIQGWAADVPLDDFKRTMILNWVRVGEPDLYLYEMIQLSDCGQLRCRTWHWIKTGKLILRTCIEETKTALDWRDFPA